ncbi:MAG: peptidoglycan-binding domain-containing protein [Candidatus Paceibacterota bacterium]|jgi:hypothetical protein
MKKYKLVLILLVLNLFIIPFTTEAITYNFGTTTLRNGSKGEAVKELQRFLNTTLNLGLVVDGRLGPKTITVIKTWQKNHGLVADGLIGKKTKDMMNSTSTSNIISITTSTPTPTPTYSCNQKDFTMALVFVSNGTTSSSDLDKYKDELNYIKGRLPWAFNFATGKLGTMSIPENPTILDSTGLVSNGTLDISATLKKFYQTHSDNFDFVTVFFNDNKHSSFHNIVKNNIKGIGLGEGDSDNSFFYGSKGKLIGINYISDLLNNERAILDGQIPTGYNLSIQDCYQQQKDNLSSLTVDNNCGMWLILHETAHQWGVYAGDVVDDDNPSKVGLGIKNSGAHYYYGLTSPEEIQDLLGGMSWKKSPNSSVYVGSHYMVNHEWNDALYSLKYHPFTLYFMGLLPQSEYDTKFNLLQKNINYQITPNFGANAMESVYKQVSVRDIISREGERKCAN